MVIEGDLEEAKTFVVARQQEQGIQEDSDSDQEMESTSKVLCCFLLQQLYFDL